jgi:hypothetical protein
MKVGEFQKAINTNSNLYLTFMAQNGAYKGSGSRVYYNAWAFFKKRELRDVKMAKKAKKTTLAESEPDDSDSAFDGEMTDDTEVYGTYSYLWWLFCAWGALALATDTVWDFGFD